MGQLQLQADGEMVVRTECLSSDVFDKVLMTDLIRAPLSPVTGALPPKSTFKALILQKGQQSNCLNG